METKAILLTILMVTLVVTSGCQGYEPPTAPLASPCADEVGASLVTPVMATPTSLISTTVEVPTRAEAAIAWAKEDLGERLDVPMRKITVLRVEAVEWPDTTLGCPQPGQMYAQLITPGYRIILKVGGEQYEYHSDRGKPVVVCAEEREPAPPTITPPSVEGLVELAKRDLAEHLGLSTDEIDVVRVMEMELPIQNFGCPGKREPGFTIPAFVMGYEIVLSAKGEEHVYHGHSGRVILCEP